MSLSELFEFATFWNVLLGVTVLGVTSGIVGCFALLRRQSLLGDALAHAALPGVCIAFLITGTKDTTALLLGAMVAGIVGALFILVVVRGSKVKEDSAIGIVLSVFFGVGVVLLTRLPAWDRSGLDRFLFGQAATLLKRDVTMLAIVGLVVFALVLSFYKEFKLICFDHAYAASLGYPVRVLEVFLTCLLVVVVVIGLQTVGVILAVASLVTPAAAARQWTDRFGVMLAVAALIGGLASATGVVASTVSTRLPTGPTIVLVASGILVVSLFLAPRRGLLRAFIRERRMAARIRCENLLKDIYAWGEQQASFSEAISLAWIMGIRGQTGKEVLRTAGDLRAKGLVEVRGESFRLTEQGLEEAGQVVRKHRLWELYLKRRLDLPADHVHRDAEAMEHALTDDAAEEFAALLGHPSHDPHGRPIPPRRGI